MFVWTYYLWDITSQFHEGICFVITSKSSCYVHFNNISDIEMLVLKYLQLHAVECLCVLKAQLYLLYFLLHAVFCAFCLVCISLFCIIFLHKGFCVGRFYREYAWSVCRMILHKKVKKCLFLQDPSLLLTVIVRL